MKWMTALVLATASALLGAADLGAQVATNLTGPWHLDARTTSASGPEVGLVQTAYVGDADLVHDGSYSFLGTVTVNSQAATIGGSITDIYVGFMVNGYKLGGTVATTAFYFSGSLNAALDTVSGTFNGYTAAGTQWGGTFTLTRVAPTNNPPSIGLNPNLTSVDLTLGQSFTMTVTGSDTDAGQSVTLSAAGLPPGMTFSATAGNPATGTVGGAPTSLGSFTATFTATDNGVPALSSQTTVVFTVSQPVNRPPAITLDPDLASINLTVGQQFSMTVTGTDPDPGQSVSLSEIGMPPGFAWSSTGGNPAIGVLSGVAQTPGTFSTAFAATGSGTPPLSSSRTVVFTVSPAPPVGGVTPDQLPRLIETLIGAGALAGGTGQALLAQAQTARREYLEFRFTPVLATLNAMGAVVTAAVRSGKLTTATGATLQTALREAVQATNGAILARNRQEAKNDLDGAEAAQEEARGDKVPGEAPKPDGDPSLSSLTVASRQYLRFIKSIVDQETAEETIDLVADCGGCVLTSVGIIPGGSTDRIDYQVTDVQTGKPVPPSNRVWEVMPHQPPYTFQVGLPGKSVAVGKGRPGSVAGPNGPPAQARDSEGNRSPVTVKATTKENLNGTDYVEIEVNFTGTELEILRHNKPCTVICIDVDLVSSGVNYHVCFLMHLLAP